MYNKDLEVGEWKMGERGVNSIRKLSYKYAFKAVIGNMRCAKKYYLFNSSYSYHYNLYDKVGQFTTPCFEDQEILKRGDLYVFF